MTALVLPNDAEAQYLQSIADQFAAEDMARDVIPRVRILRDNVKNGTDLIALAGEFSIDDPLAGKIYAPSISLRLYQQYFRYKRYDADAVRRNKDGDTVKGSYTHSILIKSLQDEAPSDDGKYQCGRPVGYIRNWKELPKDEQEFIKSCRQMAIFFGEVRIEGKDQTGSTVSMQLPVEMELSNKTSGRTLVNFYRELWNSKRVSPNSVSVTLLPFEVKGGVTFYDLSCKIEEGVQHQFDDDAIALMQRFPDYVSGINNRVMEKHKSAMLDAEDNVVDEYLELEVDDE